MIVYVDYFAFVNSSGPSTENTAIQITFNDVTETLLTEVLDGYDSGTVTTEQRTRPEYSPITIYDNGTWRYTFVSSNVAPYALVSSKVASTTPPDSCDLLIGTIITTDETSQNANNGSAGVAASSSFSNIEVSIDNINFFATPHVFENLSPGNYIAYAKDANGCTAQKPFSIVAFNNPISGGFTDGLPQVTVAPGLVSRWNASDNPIYLRFQNASDPAKKNFRIQIEITSQRGTVTGTWSPGLDGKTRADISSYVRTLVNSRDIFKHNVINWRDIDRAASFTLRYRELWDGGNSVWYNAPQPFYVTFSAMRLGDKYGGNMAEYVPMTAGGAIPPATFYYDITQGSSPYYLDNNLQLKDNAVAVVTEFVDNTGMVNIPAGNAYSVEAFVVDEPGGIGSIRLRITKNGTVICFERASNIPGARILYSVIADANATYQIETYVEYNDDFIDPVYLPDNSYVPPTGSNLAKWLTKFPEPTAWIGLPFDLSFIFSEYLINKEVKLRTTSLDINRQPTPNGVINDFLLNNDAGYILGSDTGKLIIRQGALSPVSNDGILEQLGINRLKLAGDPFTFVEYFLMQLYIGTDEAPEYVTQPIIVRLQQPCTDPYVLIKWLNHLGGWDYWRFGVNQIKSLTTANGINVDRNVFDWENDDTIADVIEKTNVNRVAFGGSFDRNDVEGLKEIPKAIRVQMLISENPIKWHTVIVVPGTFEIGRTKNQFTDLKFTILLPEENVQRNGAAPYLSDPDLLPLVPL